MANKSEPINPRMLTVPMVAKYLSATNWFVEVLIRKKELPAQKFGKRNVVDIHDVNEWIEKEKKKKQQSDRVKEILRKFRGLDLDQESRKFLDKIERGEESFLTDDSGEDPESYDPEGN